MKKQVEAARREVENNPRLKEWLDNHYVGTEDGNWVWFINDEIVTGAGALVDRFRQDFPELAEGNKDNSVAAKLRRYGRALNGGPARPRESSSANNNGGGGTSRSAKREENLVARKMARDPHVRAWIVDHYLGRQGRENRWDVPGGKTKDAAVAIQDEVPSAWPSLATSTIKSKLAAAGRLFDGEAPEGEPGLADDIEDEPEGGEAYKITIEAPGGDQRQFSTDADTAAGLLMDMIQEET